MSSHEEQIRQEIVSAIEDDALLLPTLPKVALQVQKVAKDPATDIEQMTQVIGADIALSARVIKIANSPFMRRGQQIESLKSALTGLGKNYAANLAVCLSMQQMFHSTSPIIDKRLRDTWAQSVEVAGKCQLISRFCINLSPDKATLAGLVHRIGALPILTYAEGYPSLLADTRCLDTIIDSLHSEIGDRILRSWNFPQELAQIPSEHLNFDRQVPEADYADIVTAALLYDASDSARAKHPNVTAFERLNVYVEKQATDAEGLNEEMELAKKLFLA